MPLTPCVLPTLRVTDLVRLGNDVEEVEQMADDLFALVDEPRVIATLDLDVEVLHPKLFHPRHRLAGPLDGDRSVLGAMQHQEGDVPDGVFVHIVGGHAAAGRGG